MSYKQYLNVIIDSYEPYSKNEVKKTINKYIKGHFNKTNQPIADEETHPLSGCSWKFLCRCAIRGDFKGRMRSKLNEESKRTREKLGLTLEEARRIYG